MTSTKSREPPTTPAMGWAPASGPRIYPHAQARRQDQGGHGLGQLPRRHRSGAALGGYKQSGLGREQGRQGVEAYTELKTVIIEL